MTYFLAHIVDKLVVFMRPAKFTHVSSVGAEVTLRSMSALPAFISNMTVEESFDTSAFVRQLSFISVLIPLSRGNWSGGDDPTTKH